MKTDIHALILIVVMLLRKTSSLSIDLTHQKHSIMTWFALLTFTGVETNLNFTHLSFSKPLPHGRRKCVHSSSRTNFWMYSCVSGRYVE